MKLKPIHWIAIILLLLGLGLRLIDLTDAPLAYFPAAQYHSAMLANGQVTNLPTAGLAIMESLTALVSRLVGADFISVGRLLNVLWWTVGGVVLYLLLGKVASPRAAVLPLIYYLFVPVAIESSRAFLPQVFMTVWLIIAVYGLYLWAEQPDNLKYAALAGIAGALAGLTHFAAVYMLLGLVVAGLLVAPALRKHKHVWLVAGLAVALPGLIQLAGALRTMVSWGVSWYTDPSYYVQWLNRLNSAYGWMLVLVALAGVLVANSTTKPRLRWMLAGLWGGYLAYGIAAPAEVTAENYFHLPLLPVLALSLVGLAELLVAELAQQPRAWQVFFGIVVFVGAAYPAWNAQEEWLRVDYRAQPAFLQTVADALPQQGTAIGLVEADGLALSYYDGVSVRAWRESDTKYSQSDFEHYFGEQAAGVDYFVVTLLGQFNKMPMLHDLLVENFPLLVEGDGFLIFDLR